MKSRIAFLFVVMAVLAVPCFAQFNDHQLLREVDENDGGGGGGWYDSTSYRQGQYMDNPCTPVYDWLWVDYSAYVEGAQKAAGFDRYIVNESTTMGGMYAASGEAQADVAYPQMFTVRNYHKVNTGDNFHVVTVIDFDPGSRNSYVSVETACGDGMPDSVE